MLPTAYLPFQFAWGQTSPKCNPVFQIPIPVIPSMNYAMSLTAIYSSSCSSPKPRGHLWPFPSQPTSNPISSHGEWNLDHVKQTRIQVLWFLGQDSSLLGGWSGGSSWPLQVDLLSPEELYIWLWYKQCLFLFWTLQRLGFSHHFLHLSLLKISK